VRWLRHRGGEGDRWKIHCGTSRTLHRRRETGSRPETPLLPAEIRIEPNQDWTPGAYASLRFAEETIRAIFVRDAADPAYLRMRLHLDETFINRPPPGERILYESIVAASPRPK